MLPVHPAERLFPLGPGPLCTGCRWKAPCGASETEDACRRDTGDPSLGGEWVMHPSRRYTHTVLDSLGGVEFDDVSAVAAAFPALPTYLPQIRNVSALAGALDEPVYAIRAKEVVRTRRITPAAEVRARVGLYPDQQLVLLLFDDDLILERLWEHRLQLVPDIAAAGYDGVVAASFSLWMPRPRTEHLYNLRRSLILFDDLQGSGARVIPRIGWAVPEDARRLARWADRNRNTRLVGLDVQTYRFKVDWPRQMHLLREFDRLTRRRLTYLINGPSTPGRFADVYNSVPARRVRFTNATLGPPPRDGVLDQQSLIPGENVEERFKNQCAEQRARIQRARRAIRRRGT